MFYYLGIMWKYGPVRLAEWVHERYKFPGPPADFAAVLTDFPLTVDFIDWPQDLSGVLVRAPNISSIGVNINHPLGRRNFTMWHEFYHYMAHGDEWHFECSESERHKGERECDIFATHATMKEEWVRSLNGPLWLMAERLVVSKTALRRRLRELGIRRLR